MPLLNAPRLALAGSGGDSGKTLAALGLIRAWRREGTVVQPFKKGPDYIDSAWLSRAAERTARNLDSFLMGFDGVIRSFARYSIADGLNVIEGNRGLHDGEDAAGCHSTAALAKKLNAPVVVIVPIVKITRTAAAIVLGLKMLDPQVNIAGVILNRVAGARHESVTRNAIEDATGIPVLGALPKLSGFPLPVRHLGLVTPEENDYAAFVVERSADLLGQYVDIKTIRGFAAGAPPLEVEALAVPQTVAAAKPEGLRIGWFSGPAFTFYYPENLEALAALGMELVPVNPLTDKRLPEIDALYIGGGFPETHGAHLAGNEFLKMSLREAVGTGLPVWAECGGLMYLAQAIIWQERRFEMAGMLPVEVEVGDAPQGHGYTVMTVDSPNPFFKVGTVIRGHEFHYSFIPTEIQCRTIFKMSRGAGVGSQRDGLMVNNVVAVYSHIHASATPGWAEGMTRAASDYRRWKTEPPIESNLS